MSGVVAGKCPACSASAARRWITAGAVRSPRTTSTIFISGTGLKKWKPATRSGCRQPLAMRVTDSDEVLVASTASTATSSSRARNNACLASRFSTMASISRSQSASAASVSAGRMRARVASSCSGLSLPLAAARSSVSRL
ncbi:hypothetical protein D3C80_1188560 [compost metagenome]